MRGRRALRALAIAMIALGTLVLADGVVTLVWQEPLSALYAKLRQDSLRASLKRAELKPPTPAEEHRLSSIPSELGRIAFLAGEERRRMHDGSPLGRIVIPSIGADYVVVYGTDTAALQDGPGLYRYTAFPGTGGTTAIAGHRTTYLAPFRHIDALRPGQHVVLRMPYAELRYTVLGQRVVSPGDVQAAVGEAGYTRLVLSACTPLFSAEKRLLVYARLTRIVPVGAARLLVGGAIARPIEPALRHVAPVRRALDPVLESLELHRLSALV